MKETINANIGQQVFTLDRDAYDRLTIYLNDVRRRIASDADEVIGDIEIRIAEILRESLHSSMMVVTLAMVNMAIARIGAPEDFGSATQETSESSRGVEAKQLRRSRTNRSIAGVCGGIADYLGPGRKRLSHRCRCGGFCPGNVRFTWLKWNLSARMLNSYKKSMKQRVLQNDAAARNACLRNTNGRTGVRMQIPSVLQRDPRYYVAASGSIRTMAKSLTLVPVGPVLMRPLDFSRAW